METVGIVASVPVAASFGNIACEDSHVFGCTFDTVGSAFGAVVTEEAARAAAVAFFTASNTFSSA